MSCRRVTLLVAVVGILAGGCALDETLPAPHCVTGDSALIVAQSVPTASQVPCLNDLPDGWTVDRVIINQDHTVVHLDSDRAGDESATLRYEPTCDVEGAIAVASEFADTERFELIVTITPAFSARRFYQFTGGCVWWDFAFDAGVSSTLSIEIGDTLSLVPRAELNANLREVFIDKEL